MNARLYWNNIEGHEGKWKKLPRVQTVTTNDQVAELATNN